MKIGNYYWTFCLIETIQKEIRFDINDEDLWRNYDLYNPPQYSTIELVIPLINHPHNDVENGQKEVHYHVDDRFEPIGGAFNVFWEYRISLPLKKNQILGYRKVKYVKERVLTVTDPKFISKSKLKHNCIHKNKCPHRGFDLSNTKSKFGIITCPLHGLKFNKKTKELLT